MAGIIGKLDDLLRKRAFEYGIVTMKLIPSLSLSLSLSDRPFNMANGISMEKLRFQETFLFTIIIVIIGDWIWNLRTLRILMDLREFRFLSEFEFDI